MLSLTLLQLHYCRACCVCRVCTDKEWSDEQRAAHAALRHARETTVRVT
tara:strand:+ start:126 stop:272 length:147 start_codon:yes stop_codon:yes gene_type:complete